MSKTSLKLGLAALLVIVALGPPAYGASVSAFDYIMNGYQTMAIQMDGLRFWCF